ncbi:DNA topoisomerase III [Geomicrobium sp. JCM 19037]|nr:toprim domain-containing protein [Geomicrobium sp. JCM 19037]GAK04502.1 DNA topoisomerase III [Geomicrobium sp. JCM 19037]
MKKLLAVATQVIIATDADREGENIARSIIEKARASHKPMQRLWINSLEKQEVQRGFTQLQEGDKYLSLYEEAKARQFGDWLVGMNASRAYSLLLQERGYHKRLVSVVCKHPRFA